MRGWDAGAGIRGKCEGEGEGSREKVMAAMMGDKRLIVLMMTRAIARRHEVMRKRYGTGIPHHIKA